MQGLTTDQLVAACRVFLGLAYPDQGQVPAARQIYLELPAGEDLAAYHASAPLPAASFQVLTGAEGELRGYSVRLGRTGFPHLKLRAAPVEHRGETLWVFAVDTHDAYSADYYRPPEGHPDAEPWLRMQEVNGELKQRIEKAWDAAGVLTFNGLLRLDL